MLFYCVFPYEFDAAKRYADSLCLPTQCARYSLVKKPPRNYHTSLLIKMNMKMGGVNHTLAARGKPRAVDSSVFQNPPRSISWLFDDYTMVVVSQLFTSYSSKFYFIIIIIHLIVVVIVTVVGSRCKSSGTTAWRWWWRWRRYLNRSTSCFDGWYVGTILHTYCYLRVKQRTCRDTDCRYGETSCCIL